MSWGTEMMFIGSGIEICFTFGFWSVLNSCFLFYAGVKNAVVYFLIMLHL